MKKSVLKSLSVLFLCFGLLVVFLLNPVISYANSANYNQVVILYQHDDLDSRIFKYIDESLKIVSRSELYDPKINFQLCLNDGSRYPKVVETILGSDVFTAFSNKVVVLGEVLDEYDKFKIWGEELSFIQFLSHGLVHNLQYKYHGFWDANPMGGYDQWKWEGYTDYIVLGQDRTLKEWITLLKSDRTNNYDFIDLGDGKKTIRRHVEYLTMVKYCMEVKGLDYDQLMRMKDSQSDLRKELEALAIE